MHPVISKQCTNNNAQSIRSLPGCRAGGAAAWELPAVGSCGALWLPPLLGAAPAPATAHSMIMSESEQHVNKDTQLTVAGATTVHRYASH
jgi:hypothetical protein